MGRPPKPIEHGTIKGYVTENRRGLRTCASCRKAWRKYCLPRNQAQRAKVRKRRTVGVDQTRPEEVLARFLEENAE